MKSDYNYELIRDYLDGLLDQSTSSRISQLIKADEIARGIAKGILSMRASFTTDIEIDKYLDSRLAERSSDLTSTNIKSLVYKVAASITVLFIVGISIFFYSKKATTDEQVMLFLSEPYPISAALRTNDASHINHAIDAYQSGDFVSCANALREDHSAFGMFYKGLSALYLNENKLAIQYLGDKTVTNSRYADIATWYLALSYFQIGDVQLSKASLKSLTEDINNYRYEEAVALLKAID